MKDFRGMKRQRSRNRKPSGNQNNPNRAYESNGPEGTKVRGNAQTIYEKYQQLARDANSSGDRVLAENHLQHAEHYFRLIRQMQPQRPVSEFVQRDPFSNGYDDFDDEIETEAVATETEGDTGVPGDEAQPGFDDTGNGRQRFEQRDRNNNRDRDRNGNRDNRDRDRSNNRDRDQQRSFEPRTYEPRNNAGNGGGEEGGEFEGGRRESRRERYERRRQQRLSEQEQVVGNSAAPNGSGYIASTEPLGARPAPVQTDMAFESVPTPQPEVRERPARVKTPASEDDASHLPAFLRAPAPVAAAPAAEAETGEEVAAKPKRGRPKRKTEATEEA